MHMCLLICPCSFSKHWINREGYKKLLTPPLDKNKIFLKNNFKCELLVQINLDKLVSHMSMRQVTNNIQNDSIN